MKVNIIQNLKTSLSSINPKNYEKVFEEQKNKGKFLWDAVNLIQLPALLFIFVSIGIGVVVTIVTTLGFPSLIIQIISQIMLINLLVYAGILIKFIIEQYILKFLSGFFGGKGSIDSQAYLLGLVTAGIFLVNTVLGIFVIGMLLFPITLLWYLFLMYKILIKVHKLSSVNAIIVVILDVIIWAIALGAFTALMTVMGFGMSAVMDEFFF